MSYQVTVRPGFSVNLGGKTINTIGAQSNTVVELTDYEVSRDIGPSSVSSSDSTKPIVSMVAGEKVNVDKIRRVERAQLVDLSDLNATALPTAMASPPTSTVTAGAGFAGYAAAVTGSSFTSAKYWQIFLDPYNQGTTINPVFTNLGARLFIRSTSTSTQIRAAETSYGVTSSAGNAVSAPGRVEFMHFGTAFEIMWWAGTANGLTRRIWIDGVPITVRASTAAASNATNVYLEKIDFGSIGLRRITVDFNTGTLFMGVLTPPTESLSPTVLPSGPKMVVGPGDSFTSGANGVNGLDTYAVNVATMLGIRNATVNGIGGTGFVANQRVFGERVNDIIALNPDIVLMPSSVNDSINNHTGATLAAAATAAWTAMRAGLPNAYIIVTGIMAPGGAGADAKHLTGNATLQTAAQAAIAAGIVDYFIDAYPNNDTTDLRNWFTGTGHAGAPATNGNASVMTSNDQVHPTQTGSDYLAARLAHEIASYLRKAAKGQA